LWRLPVADDIETEDTGEEGDDSIADLSRDQILEHALRIARDYRRRGFSLTLRQLYYRFVSEALAPSSQRTYKRIGAALTEARYDGRFPIDLLEDRGRDVGIGQFTRTTDDIGDAVADIDKITAGLPDYLIERAHWFGQSTFVSVWVEKQALEGVFASAAGGQGVGLFACKGYPSVSALYDFAVAGYFAIRGEHRDPQHREPHRRRYSWGHGFDWTEHHRGTAERAVVLYFGDHDPDGWEIPRSALAGLRKVQRTYGLDFPIEFKRIALNMDQVTQYNPPPFEAKMSSPRYRKYRDEHDTDSAWELDALDPAVLQTLIRNAIRPYFEPAIYQANCARVAELREQLRTFLRERSAQVEPNGDDANDDSDGGEE
jgi:hypothetical protein